MIGFKLRRQEQTLKSSNHINNLRVFRKPLLQRSKFGKPVCLTSVLNELFKVDGLSVQLI